MHARVGLVVLLAVFAAFAAWSHRQTSRLRQRVAALEARSWRAPNVPVTDIEFRVQLIEGRLNAVEAEMEPEFMHRKLTPQLRAVRDYPSLR